MKFWLSQLLTQFRFKRRALALLREVVREDPRHAQAWSCIGFLLAGQGRIEEALDAFGRARALDAQDAPSHFNLAYMLQRLGRHEEALPAFARAIEIAPRTDRAWYGLGLSLAALGRLEEAALKLEEAVRLQPENPYAGYQLAGIWHRLGRTDRLRAEYERVRGFDARVAEHIGLEFGLLKK